jgi:hypothetical protein
MKSEMQIKSVYNRKIWNSHGDPPMNLSLFLKMAPLAGEHPRKVRRSIFMKIHTLSKTLKKLSRS